MAKMEQGQGQGQGQGEAGPSTIPLYLINGVATIWDAQTAATLHCQHDISGLRVGTLPGVSQQNGFLGLPMTLMQEETAYLVNSGICHLIPVPITPTIPTASQIQNQKEARISRIQNLEKIAREEAERNARAAKEMFTKGGDKARTKREERAKAKAAKKGEGEGESLFIPESESLKNGEGSTSKCQSITTTTTMAKEASSKQKQKQVTPTPGYFHTIPSLPPTLPSTPPISLPNVQFPYPKTTQQSANLTTFTQLSVKNYRMGLGPRFGGEYLIYPGDYLRYHAHFTSQVVRYNEYMRPMEIVAWGRLGTGTKKAGLICCVPESSEASRAWEDGGSGDGEGDGSGAGEGDRSRVGEDETKNQEGVDEEEEKGGVEFYSLEWANFG